MMMMMTCQIYLDAMMMLAVMAARAMRRARALWLMALTSQRHRDVKGLNVMLGYAKDALTDEPDVEIALARFMKLIDVGRLAKIADGAPAAAHSSAVLTQVPRSGPPDRARRQGAVQGFSC